VAIESVFCHVGRVHVTIVKDFEGAIVRLICPERHASTGVCRLRAGALSQGPLSALLERLDEGTLDRRSTRCELLQ
jgi:hypothetical protein